MDLKALTPAIILTREMMMRTEAQQRAEYERKRRKAASVQMLREALGAFKETRATPEALSALIADEYDAAFLETLSNLIGRHAHSKARENA